MDQHGAVTSWTDRYMRNRDNQYVSESNLGRAVHVLELVGDAALARGFAIPMPDDPLLMETNGDDMTWAHLAFQTEDAVYFVRVQEISTPNSPRRPTATEDDAALPRWMTERVREFVGTGLLQLSIRSDGDKDCRRTARDTATSSLEEKIPTIMREFMDAKARRDKMREEHALWEQAKVKAKERYTNDHLIASIDGQVERHQMMMKRREYLASVERSLASYDGDDKESVIRRVEELRERIDAADPGLHPERLERDVPQPSDKDLEPYMGGWSIDGPYRVSSPNPDSTIGMRPRWSGSYGSPSQRNACRYC